MDSLGRVVVDVVVDVVVVVVVVDEVDGGGGLVAFATVDATVDATSVNRS